MTEFKPSIGGGESPDHAAFVRVAIRLPLRDFGFQLRHSTYPSVQTLLGQHAQFDLRHIQPAPIARRVVDLQTLRQPSGRLGVKRLVKTGYVVRVQIIAHQLHLAGVGIVLLQQRADLPSPIDPRPAVLTTHATPTPDGVEKHKQCLSSPTLVVVILFRHSTGSSRNLDTAKQLLARFIHADQWLLRRVLGSVQVEDVLHLGDEAGRIPLRDAPTLLPPGFEVIFLRALRTVSRHTDVTRPRRLSSSVNSDNVQRARPSGLGPQQMATKWASTRPSIL